MYLFRNHRQTFSWPGERPSSHLKVTKMWFGPNITYFRNPSLRIFAAWKASLVIIILVLSIYASSKEIWKYGNISTFSCMEKFPERAFEVKQKPFFFICKGLLVAGNQAQTWETWDLIWYSLVFSEIAEGRRGGGV